MLTQATLNCSTRSWVTPNVPGLSYQEFHKHCPPQLYTHTDLYIIDQPWLVKPTVFLITHASLNTRTTSLKGMKEYMIFTQKSREENKTEENLLRIHLHSNLEYLNVNQNHLDWPSTCMNTKNLTFFHCSKCAYTGMNIQLRARTTKVKNGK